MNMYKINQEKQETERRISKIKAFLSDIPDGQISQFRKNNSFYYVIGSTNNGQRNRKYISCKETELIEQYAKKAYYQRLLRILERNLKGYKVLGKCVDPNPELTVLSSLPEWIVRIIKSSAASDREKYISEWVAAEYNQNPAFPETRNIQTLSGDFVRSKGEREIANELYRKQIPYRTDCEVVLKDGIIYADFVILHPRTTELYYWEHSGKLGDPSYIKSNYDRISRYAASGILIGERLIMTGENEKHVIKSQTIERIIETYFEE